MVAVGSCSSLGLNRPGQKTINNNKKTIITENNEYRPDRGGGAKGGGMEGTPLPPEEVDGMRTLEEPTDIPDLPPLLLAEVALGGLKESPKGSKGGSS